VFDVAGVDQPRLESVRLQQVVDRFPVVRGGLHDHTRDSQFGQPIGHPQQRTRHRGVRHHLLQAPARAPVIRHPRTAHHLGLAYIARRDPSDDLLILGVLLQHRDLLTATKNNQVVAREGRVGTANLIRVLEATLKLPQPQPSAPC
jgi:hypothetical protein